jgi:UDP-N-acetylglucosamine--N-acetylmuramyl-(pentapeptide) pyrophosphoryl-undecaprenol N-acetylglucosamine transferase
MPNIAIIQELRDRMGPDASLLYIGERGGLEKKLITELDVSFKPILCGKMRRYFSWRNFVDIFKIPIGIFQALSAMCSFKPDVIFCKGGYVTFPVAVAGFLFRKPVILHESDVVPGLSNKMSAFFADKICVSFEESKKYFKEKKVVVTGNPVRRMLEHGSSSKGKSFTGLQDNKKTILFMGGSQGADFINNIVWQNFNELLKRYQVIHICGEGKEKTQEQLLKLLSKDNHQNIINYRAFSFIDKELRDVYAFCDLVVSRAGANSLSEISFFGKPAVLIPLGRAASRGDQIINAEVYTKNNPAVIIKEEDFEHDSFFRKIENLLKEAEKNPHKKTNRFEATDKIISLILEA